MIRYKNNIVARIYLVIKKTINKYYNMLTRKKIPCFDCLVRVTFCKILYISIKKKMVSKISHILKIQHIAWQ